MTHPLDMVEVGTLVADMDANAVLGRHAMNQKPEDRPEYLSFMVDQLRMSLEGWSLLLSNMNIPQRENDNKPIETDESRIVDNMEVDARIARDLLTIDEKRRTTLVIHIVSRVEITLVGWTILKEHATGGPC